MNDFFQQSGSEILILPFGTFAISNTGWMSRNATLWENNAEDKNNAAFHAASDSQFMSPSKS